MKTKLAMLGGQPAVPQEFRSVEWPVITEADQKAVFRALHSGKLVSNAAGEEEITALESEWANFVGVRYCTAVSSGTAALHLALSALGVGPGAEVIVPALSFNATALAALYQLAVPVFVDVKPDTFNIDPQQLEMALTPRTRAIIPVHLHGLPADMDDILTIANQQSIPVIEDAAQAHGAVYRERQVGSMGVINCFSLHPSKNLPACGEGGLITTQNSELYEQISSQRQFGERLEEGKPRSYIAHTIGWNYKLNPIQAAFVRSQFERFTEYQCARTANVERFLQRLAELPGIVVPHCPPDRSHAWHILRFRFDPLAFDLTDVSSSALRHAFHRALRAEGVPVSRYQVVPLPTHEAFQKHLRTIDLSATDVDNYLTNYHPKNFPHTMAIIADSLCLQIRHLNPFAGETLERYADGFEKVWQNLDIIIRYAHGMTKQ